jgi:iron complex outermembrane receptor protein
LQKLLFFSLLLGFPLALPAQERCTYFLDVRVFAAADQNALQGAEVIVKETGLVVASDQQGRARLGSLCGGTYTITVRFVGFVPQAKVITVPGPELRVDLDEERQLLSEVIVQEHAPTLGPAQTVTVLGTQELAQALGKPLGEVLKDLPGVSAIQSGPAIFKPVIHGVHSQRILILNNGVRQEGQQWGAEHAPEIDPFIASNVMVIKDAGAIKYGTDALGGVIIVTPADLPDRPEFGGKFHLLGASNGRSGTVSGLLEGGIAKGWGWRAHGTLRRAGDFHAPDYVLSNTGFREGSFSLAVGQHREHAGLDIFFSHFQTTIGVLRGSAVGSARDLANALDREPPAFTQPFSYTIQQPRQEVSHSLLKATTHWERGVHNVRIQYGLQYNKRLEFDVRRGTLREIPALGFQLFTHTLDVEWEQQRTSNRSRSWGLNGMLQDNNKIDGTQTIPFIPNYTNVSGGLFAVEKWAYGRWQWDAGLRYDWRAYRIVGFDFANRIFRASNTFHNVSGTLGAHYQITKHQSLATTLGTTWRPPNVAELYSLGTHQSAAAIEYGLLLDEQTTEVRPLSDTQFANEQAVKWVGSYSARTDRMQWDVSAYANYIFNYIYLRPTGVTESLRGVFPYFRYTQTNALFVGLDGNHTYQFNRHWSARTRISVLRASDARANDFLIFIPPNRVEVALRYEKPVWGTWTNFYVEAKPRYVFRQTRAPRVVSVGEIIDAKDAGVDLFATDNRIFDFQGAPPAYFWMGGAIGVSRTVNESRLDFRLSVENALNRAYREYTNRMRYFADEIGRNVSFSASLAF